MSDFTNPTQPPVDRHSQADKIKMAQYLAMYLLLNPELEDSFIIPIEAGDTFRRGELSYMAMESKTPLPDVYFDINELDAIEWDLIKLQRYELAERSPDEGMPYPLRGMLLPLNY